MTAYFNKTGWPEKAPSDEEERKQFIASLHKRKTELFMVLIEKKLLPLRPGVAKLVIIWTSFSMQYWYLGLIITYNSTVYALASQLVGNTHRLFDQVQTSVLLSWWMSCIAYILNDLLPWDFCVLLHPWYALNLSMWICVSDVSHILFHYLVPLFNNYR